MVLTHIGGLITLLITTHEPPREERTFAALWLSEGQPKPPLSKSVFFFFLRPCLGIVFRGCKGTTYSRQLPQLKFTDRCTICPASRKVPIKWGGGG